MRVPTSKFQNAFGKYLKHVQTGEEVIVTKNGKGVAKLIRYSDPLIHLVKEGASDYEISKYMTYQDFLEVSESSDSRYELIDGEIFLLSSPKRKHQVAVSEILGQMYIYFRGKTCRPLTAPFDVRLYNDAGCFEDDPNVVQPDVLVICDHENIDERDTYQGIPSLVVEVLSSSSRSKDLIKKMRLYVNSNVPEYWAVDPDNKNITVYEIIDRKIERTSTYRYGEIIESFYFEDLMVSTENM
ncbi:type II toxin-antitoxin system prevent-host-death family antitoxin [Acidaminobacter sp. JC074]|uniref:type II toxin-antitoxin system prevent-host-death family antitoxin n=1 Tax=Acidaminobacter sp. JC074 TaxID=2530199 RepID=UPI001F0F7479|nr:type II toxin-antitoxin system prevent-host-death family antitoxin [Acidaminobacter sp. JC074]MCH4886827.1 type II toxin-antitoxin system prevent-host-death family antitoxin [Acidaminobacter sp. JC074]